MKNDMIKVKGLKKSYGKVEVLKGVDFTVAKGSILALLGPNGAGKTTTVRILSTLLQADDGELEISGFDVRNQPEKVRTVIGLTGQSAAVDELLTGRENLIMMGRLYRLTKQSAVERAEELLREFDLVAAADRTAKTYSGGMRRRLDLAVSLIATPPVIFLDEPTTGLDPRSRIAMWDIIKSLVADGRTILLTTQYLEEADQLADSIVVIDNGVAIAQGTATEQKSKIGNDRLELSFPDAKTLKKAVVALGKSVADVDEKDFVAVVAVKNTGADVRSALNTLADKQIKIASMDIRKPTLDDVFLSLTGKAKTDETEETETK